MNDVDNDRDLFKMVGWSTSNSRIRYPHLLRPEGSKAATAQERSTVLLTEHLPADQSNKDLQQPPLVGPSLEAWADFSTEEIGKAVLQTPSTAPGTDCIPTGVLRICWPEIRQHVTALFQGCLDTSFHPRCFWTAVLIPLLKPGRDHSLPRSYGLISLLSVLGKALERLFARRFAHQAIASDITPPQYFGALPLRSAADLTALLTLDVKGAFDAILPRQLLHRLLEQGWLLNTISGIGFFLNNRSA